MLASAGLLEPNTHPAAILGNELNAASLERVPDRKYSRMIRLSLFRLEGIDRRLSHIGLLGQLSLSPAQQPSGSDALLSDDSFSF